MFLSWWMIITLGVFWLLSIVNHGLFMNNRGVERGAAEILTILQDDGYIKIKQDGNIIGLCNRGQEEWEDK